MSGLPTRESVQRSVAPRRVGLGAAFARVGALLPAQASERGDTGFGGVERLAIVQQGCRSNQAWATDDLCRQAAEALRRKFRGSGVPYTPTLVDPFPSAPQPSADTTPAAPAPGTEPAVRVPHPLGNPRLEGRR